MDDRSRQPDAAEQEVRDRSRSTTPGTFIAFLATLAVSIGLGRLFGRFRRGDSAGRHTHAGQADQDAELERKRQIGYEPSDVRVRPLVWILIGAAIFSVVLSIALFGLLALFAGRPQIVGGPVTALTTTPASPPEPRLQTNPSEDWASLRATEEARLNSYALDPASGGVRIPIDRAIEILAEEGLPAGGAEPVATPMPGTAQPVAAGERLFTSLGCAGCHRMEAGGVGPSLVGIFGTEEQLENGSSVTVDEAYLRNSILNPNAEIVAGYEPIMPAYEGRVSEEELEQLIAYIRSLDDQADEGGGS